MRVTASKVGLLAECQYFARDEAQWVDSASEASKRGNKFHAAIAEYVESGEFSAEAANGVEALMLSAKRWVDEFGRASLSAEVAFAWDPATDTAERINIKERDYSAFPSKLCGTADLVAISRAARVGYIGDWKTGDGSRARAQLRALAVMLARAEGLDSVTVEALEVSETGVRSVCREELGDFDLAAIAAEIHESIARIRDSEPVPGSHCSDHYCPARATCPVGVAIVETVIPAESLVRHKWSLTIEGPDHAAWLLEHARLVESAAKAVKDAVRTATPAEGWRLADGRVLRESMRDVPRFDKGKALELLRRLGATEQDISELTYVFRESAGLRISGRKAA